MAVLNPLGSVTVTVTRPGTPIQGPRGRLPGTPTTHTIPNCAVQPLKGIRGASNETFTAEADYVTTRYWLFAPLGADLLATDRVTVPGITSDLQVMGDPAEWPDIHSNPDHVECFLEKWSG